jgi:protocatechuate 3,4-dioxygenase beta subunit
MISRSFLRTIAAAWLVAGWLSATVAQPPPEVTTVSGTVTRARDGKPVAEAWVSMQEVREGEEAGPGVTLEAVTDADGKYLFEEVSEGEYEVWACPERHASPQQRHRLTITGENPLVEDFALKEAQWATFRLVDAAGQPVGETDFVISVATLTTGSRMAGQRRTDAAGQHRTFLEARQKYRLFVTSERGWAATEVFTMRPDEDLDLGDLRLEPVGSVSGTVYQEPSYAPAVDHWLGLQAQTPALREIYLTARTDREGRFVFPTVPPGEYRLDQQTVAVKAHERAEVSIAIPAPGRITGRLVGPDGKPVANVTVRFTANVRIDQRRGLVPTYQAVTGADGSYEIAGAQPGETLMTVLAPGHGYGISRRFVVQPGKTSVDIDFALQPTVSVSGVVRNKTTGQPVLGAGVSLRTYGGEWSFESEQVKADEQGRFTIPDLPPGEGYVLAAVTGYFQPKPLPLTLPAGRNQTGVVVELSPLLAFSGRLVAEDGQTPLADVMVYLGRTRQVTGADGRFEFSNLRSGQQRLKALLPTGLVVSREASLAEGENPPELVWVLGAEGAQIAGRITQRPGGEGRAGVPVIALQTKDSHWLQPTVRPLRPEEVEQRLDEVAYWAARTDGEGRYRLLGLPRGTYSLTVLAEGCRSEQREGVVVVEEAVVRDVDFELAPPGAYIFSGRVFRPEGTLLAEASLTLTYRRIPQGPRRRLEVLTTAAGHYALPLPEAGEYEIVAEAPEVGRSRMLEVSVNNEEETTGVDLHLVTVPRGDLRGTVVIPDGTTHAAGVTVILLATDGSEKYGVYTQWAGQTLRLVEQGTVTDEDGQFALEKIEVGTYRLYASPTGRPEFWGVPAAEALRTAHAVMTEPFSVEEGTTRELTIRLGLAGRIVGTLRTADGKEPLANARVMPRAGNNVPFNGYAYFVRTDSEGRFEIPCLAPAVYTLSITAPDRQSMPYRNVQVVGGQATELPDLRFQQRE